MSYGELDAVMTRIGAALQRDGVQPGGTIAICATSSIEYAAVYLGAVRAGVVVAPLAPSSTAQSLAGMAADAGAQILFVDADVAAALQPVLPQLGATRLVTLDGSAAGQAFEAWLAPAGAPFAEPEVRPEQPLNIIYRPAPPAYPRASCNRTACAGRMCRAGR